MNGSKEKLPEISVVMSVYNGERHLEKTLNSMLVQTFRDFEFIIINDGSSDRTAEVLQQYAEKDSRIRAIYQENTGLTHALINGCSLARGEFIARQDAGDISFPERLEIQLELLTANPRTVLVGCGAEFITPANEVLYQCLSPGLQLERGLGVLSLDKIKGPPHHGGVMFKRRAYETCGGYRPQFRVAQDIDLWLRLCEIGSCQGNHEVLYQASVESGSISVRCGPEQYYFGGIAIESAKLRRAGLDDAKLLQNIRLSERPFKSFQKTNHAGYYYFLASMLADTNKAAARKYLDKALGENPLHIKARLRRMTLGKK